MSGKQCLRTNPWTVTYLLQNKRMFSKEDLPASCLAFPQEYVTIPFFVVAVLVLDHKNYTELSIFPTVTVL